MDFTLWLLFVPVHWTARIEQVTSTGFTDVQLSGPFETWRHRHTFVPVDECNTEVQDTVEATLSTTPFKRLVSWGMWVSLPLLFAYRAWKTTQLLEARI
jgi:ligand-binding SRPBCC domain-containing protein